MKTVFADCEGKRPEHRGTRATGRKMRTSWHQLKAVITVNKVLYRRFQHQSGMKDKEEPQLILPEILVVATTKVEKSFCVSTVWAYPKTYFWWPAMRDGNLDVIPQCEAGMKYEGPTQQVIAPLKFLQKSMASGHVCTSIT